MYSINYNTWVKGLCDSGILLKNAVKGGLDYISDFQFHS